MTLRAQEVELRLSTSSFVDQSCIEDVRMCKSIIEARQPILVYQSDMFGNWAPCHLWPRMHLCGPSTALILHQSRDLLSYYIVLHDVLFVLLRYVLECCDASELHVLFSLPGSKERNDLVLAVQGCMWAACTRNTQMWW